MNYKELSFTDFDLDKGFNFFLKRYQNEYKEKVLLENINSVSKGNLDLSTFSKKEEVKRVCFKKEDLKSILSKFFTSEYY